MRRFAENVSFKKSRCDIPNVFVWMHMNTDPGSLIEITKTFTAQCFLCSSFCDAIPYTETVELILFEAGQKSRYGGIHQTYVPN